MDLDDLCNRAESIRDRIKAGVTKTALVAVTTSSNLNVYIFWHLLDFECYV